MFNLLNCYLSGRHDYDMWGEKGTIFLRCVHCGKRSSGWAIDPKPAKTALKPTRKVDSPRTARSQ
jgi:hypothetical protein